MNKEKDLVEHKKGELVAPKIELSDITTLIDVTSGLRPLRQKVEEAHKNSLEESLQNASKRVRKRRLFQAYEVDYLGSDFFNQCEDINSQLVKDLYPEELEAIVDYSAGIGEVNKRFMRISEENSVFLRYFFLTPLNEANWERFIKEIVPVAERTSILFGLYNETRVRPFEKSGHEKGSGQMESMQMIPFALKEEYTDFYVRKILGATQDYNVEIKRFVNMLSRFKQRETTPDDHLEMDVRIMNYCLENMVRKPYTPATGAFAIQLCTATSRIGKELKGINKQLEDTAQSFLKTRIKNRIDFAYMAERLGFRVKWGGNDYSMRPEYALRKVEDSSVALR